ERDAEAVREVVLVLDAAGEHVLCAQRIVAKARSDLTPVVAADAAAAAGVEAQGRGHGHQCVGPGVAGFAAHDQTVALADAAVPAGARVHLGEARVRARALDPPAQDDVPADAPARENAVIHVHVL